MIMASSESQVQCTNDSATLSKCSASRSGYWNDPVVSHFVTRCPRRAPIIHWGYWIRNQALEWVQNAFLDNYKDHKQILSLGAGFDTTYFRLISTRKLDSTLYIEVDFPEVVTRKKVVISSNTSLSHGDEYRLIGCDITQLDVLESLLVEEGGINKDTPTLILAEVVLTYINPRKVDCLISRLSQFFSNATFCVYEQINPTDGFGQVMLRHFKSISSPLLNIEAFPFLADSQKRFLEHGWPAVVSCDVNSFYFHLPMDIRNRILSLEPFDEFEEWHLTCRHYQLLCALKGDALPLKRVISPPLVVEDTVSVTSKETWKCQWNTARTWELQRYGHGAVAIDHGVFLMYGGFGVTGPSHSQARLASLIYLTAHTAMPDVHAKEIQVRGDGPGPLIHHTLTLLPSRDILLVGGRSSPKRQNPYIYLLQNNKDIEWMWKKMELLVSFKGPYEYKGRWRHTTNLVDESVVVIIGGCTEGTEVLNDIWQLDTVNRKMECLSVFLSSGRHSHVTVTVGKNELLVIGGLNSSLYPHSSCLKLFKTAKNDWKIEEVGFSPPLPPRYSMTAHLLKNNKVMLVGGVQVTTVSESAPILIVDLFNLTWSGVDIEYPIDMPLPLLHNHKSFVWSKNTSTKYETLLVAGGGGNCFSFGTHFNRTIEIFIPTE